MAASGQFQYALANAWVWVLSLDHVFEHLTFKEGDPHPHHRWRPESSRDTPSGTENWPHISALQDVA